MSDPVDRAIEQWRSVDPDLALGPVEILGRLQQAARLVNAEVQRFARQYGLDQSELDMLMTLRRNGGASTAGELLASSMVTSGTITNRIDRLEGKDLVVRRRSDTDRRSVTVQLTPGGTRLVDEAIVGHLANEARLLRALDPAQASAVEHALRALLAALSTASSSSSSSSS